jgi:hypothetical protein
VLPLSEVPIGAVSRRIPALARVTAALRDRHQRFLISDPIHVLVPGHGYHVRRLIDSARNMLLLIVSQTSVIYDRRERENKSSYSSDFFFPAAGLGNLEKKGFL